MLLRLLPEAAALASRPRRALGALTAVMLGGLAAHLAYTTTGLGGEVADTVINRWGQDVIYATAAALCALRAFSVRQGRAAWLALAVALGLYTAGSLYYTTVFYTLADAPFPSPADLGWLALYPGAYVCLGLIVRDSVRRFPPSVWLDGLVATLAVAGAGVGLVVVPVLSKAQGTLVAVVTNAAYPLGDLVLLSLTIGVVALHGWRGRGLLLLASGLAAFAAADSIYLYRVAFDTLQPGTPLDSLWLVGVALMAVAAWQPPCTTGAAQLGGGAMLVMPLGFGLGALALLALATVYRVPAVAAALAVAAVAASMVRTVLSLHELRSLAETRHQASTDELTRLPNRRAFNGALAAAIERAGGLGETLAVMVIDLDHFKELNDTLGHHAGDLLLEQIGPRLRSALRAEDLLARLGGDEFAILLPDARAAETVVPRIAASLEPRFAIDGIELQVDASVGVALYPEHGSDAETLMQRADVAMYVAKERRSGVEIYARERDRHTRERLELIADLRDAVHARALVLNYQPKVAVASGDVTGAEALLRWPHPTRGMVAPSEFIALAEQTGVIRPLTDFVLDEAVRQAAAWHADGLELDMAVNVSASCLLDLGWSDTVTATLVRHRLPAGRLILEITEDVLMADPERALAAVDALAGIGVRVSVDDFGTGYSSLAYLKRLPVAELKVDRSFVRELPSDPADAAIVRAITALAHQLDITVVAEGVESASTLEPLAALGADIVQGFYFSAALPPDRFVAWLAERTAALAA